VKVKVELIKLNKKTIKSTVLSNSSRLIVVKHKGFMRITLLMVCFICTSMMSQNIKKKKKSGLIYQEVFTFDKNSKERQGYYFKIGKNSKDTVVIGTYEQGKKVGIWSYMGEKNSLYLRYDYEQNKILDNIERTFKKDSVQVKIKGRYRLTKVDCPPMHIGFKNEIKQGLNVEIKPPAAVFQEAKSGIVLASFEVNEKGETFNFNIESSYNEKLNKTIEDSLRPYKYQWIPALVDGEPVVSKMYIMLNFSFISDPNDRTKPQFEDKADLIVVNLTYLGIVRTIKQVN